MTESERKRIFGLSRRLGMNSDELHLLIGGITGCDSIKALDPHQTREVIEELTARADRADRQCSTQKAPPQNVRKRKTACVPGMITPAQQGMCRGLMYDIAEFDPKDKPVGERLCGAIGKILGITAFPEQPFRFITAEQGRTLIEGLKRYCESAERKAIREGRTGRKNSV